MNALAQRLPAAGLDAGRIQLRAAPVDLAAFAAHVRGDPGFPVMRDAVIQNIVQLFRGDYLLSRLMLEEGRYVTIQMLLTLAATQQAEERSTWLTLGRLQQSLAGSELASRNRIEALVAVLERYGFVERRKAEEDLRLTLLLPTARLWGVDALFVEAMVQPLARLAPTRPPPAQPPRAALPPQPQFRNPDGWRAHLRSAGAGLVHPRCGCRRRRASQLAPPVRTSAHRLSGAPRDACIHPAVGDTRRRLYGAASAAR